MEGNKQKKGPLASFEPSEEDIPMGAEELPEDIEEKVLEEIGSLQFKAVMERLDTLEAKLDDALELLKIIKEHLEEERT